MQSRRSPGRLRDSANGRDRLVVACRVPAAARCEASAAGTSGSVRVMLQRKDEAPVTGRAAGGRARIHLVPCSARDESRSPVEPTRFSSAGWSVLRAPEGPVHRRRATGARAADDLRLEERCGPGATSDCSQSCAPRRAAMGYLICAEASIASNADSPGVRSGPARHASAAYQPVAPPMGRTVTSIDSSPPTAAHSGFAEPFDTRAA